LGYTDFWRFDENGRCAENRVHLDIVDAFRRMDRDFLDGKGWDDRRQGVFRSSGRRLIAENALIIES
jgi:hypothetical protein